MGSALRKVDVPFGIDGSWRVEGMSVSKDDSAMSFITGRGRGVPPGEYTALRRGGTLVMSDTPDELRDHVGPVNAAKGGRVLIAGLGLGCVVQAILDEPRVERLTVVEKASEVIRLVAPTYQERYGDRLEVVEADIFEWESPKGVRYSVFWADIWDDICSDNLKAMMTLKKRFARRADWRGCWSEIRAQRAAKS